MRARKGIPSQETTGLARPTRLLPTGAHLLPTTPPVGRGHMEEELDFFKRAVNLVDLATNFGYAVAPRAGSPSAASVAMDNPVTGDKIVIRRDRDGYWT